MRPTNKKLSDKEALYQRGLLHCSSCRTEKLIDRFGTKADGFHGKHPLCRECVNAKNRSYSALPQYREKKLESQRRRRAAGERPTPEQNRRNTLRRYGITPEDYERMFEEQGGRCAICGGTDAMTPSGVFHVDHCHDTGAVRGLLCGACNPALGVFCTSELLAAAAQYLAATPSA